MPIIPVEIQGGGVAAACCAYRLAAPQYDVRIQRVERPRLPAILLSGAALALLRDVFDKPDLLRDAPRIRRRVVAWCPDRPPIELPHSAVVVSEESLLAGLRRETTFTETQEAPCWTVFAGSHTPESARVRRFGTCVATATSVRLKQGALAETCWMEALPSGWLFLVTTAPDAGWLLSVGGSADEQLGCSRVIVNQISATGAKDREFPCSPKIVWPLAGSGWLACGTAAMAFDPICGDGTAHAVREAILAAAVIDAAFRGADVGELIVHYRSRLIAGFARHLHACREFYRNGFGGPWWTAEIEALEEGLAWCAEQTIPVFRYCLQDFRLETLERGSRPLSPSSALPDHTPRTIYQRG